MGNECDWESVGNREAVRQQVGTRQCSCVKKGNRCGPGCRCSSPTGTQQQSSDELVEIQEEELLRDDSLRREYG